MPDNKAVDMAIIDVLDKLFELVSSINAIDDPYGAERGNLLYDIDNAICILRDLTEEN